MKYLITLLLLWCAMPVSANPTLNKLTEVNVCWKEQPDIDISALPVYHSRSETEWIQLHLSLVEHTLRKRSLAGLTGTQVQNRLTALDHLHEYWLAGKFPQNENYTYRTPIFIDNHNTFCAVGYLVKVTGYESVSRMIASKTNLAYVKEMHYPELDQWAEKYGFTKDELAWIQPGYPPSQEASGVGEGVDGIVYELYADDARGRLYVGGDFLNVDGNIEAHNIAYVTEQNGVYTWHNMGAGVNGKVHAIAKYDGKIFVAGKFSEAGDQAASNIAYWDGTAWYSAGCTYGEVYDLVVYKDELYACGSFDVCAALSDVNVAKWNGTNWQQMPGLSGKVNTMEVAGDDLILGGAFMYQNEPVNAIRWNAQQHYQTFESNIQNEVMDFEKYGDTLYAATRQSSPAQFNVSLMHLEGNSWTVPDFPFLSFYTFEDQISFNTLCVNGDEMMIGGRFRYMPGVGVYGENAITLIGGHIGNGNWFLLDSTVNKMVRFKGQLFAGGAFKHAGTLSSVLLNGIARSGNITGIDAVTDDNSFRIFPNPVTGNTLQVENDIRATRLTITDMSGRSLALMPLQAGAQKQKVQLPSLAPGMYLFNISNPKGQRMIKKVLMH